MVGSPPSRMIAARICPSCTGPVVNGQPLMEPTPVYRPGRRVASVNAAWPPHGQARDRVPPVAVEPAVDQRRQFDGQERLPLRTPERRVVVLPVRVERPLAAGQHRIDVLVAEIPVRAGFPNPVADRRLVAAPVEEIQRPARPGVRRVQHAHRHVPAHRSRTDHQIVPLRPDRHTADHRRRRGYRCRQDDSLRTRDDRTGDERGREDPGQPAPSTTHPGSTPSCPRKSS